MPFLYLGSSGKCGPLEKDKVGKNMLICPWCISFTSLREPVLMRETHMSVMFSISASVCRTGKALIPRSGSTQEILVLLQEQEEGHASADIHGSPEPTATPTTNTHHHQQQHRHDPNRLPGEERAPLPGLKALISGAANFSYKARWIAPRPGPGWLGSAPVRPIEERRNKTKSAAEMDAGYKTIDLSGDDRLEGEKGVGKRENRRACSPFPVWFLQNPPVSQPVSQNLTATLAMCAKEDRSRSPPPLSLSWQAPEPPPDRVVVCGG